MSPPAPIWSCCASCSKRDMCSRPRSGPCVAILCTFDRRRDPSLENRRLLAGPRRGLGEMFYPGRGKPQLPALCGESKLGRRSRPHDCSAGYARTFHFRNQRAPIFHWPTRSTVIVPHALTMSTPCRKQGHDLADGLPAWYPIENKSSSPRKGVTAACSTSRLSRCTCP